MRIHTISDCTRSYSTLANQCSKRSLDRSIITFLLSQSFPPPPSFPLHQVFFSFSLFSVSFYAFTKLDCHSNRSNCWFVRWSPAMSNKYLCRHLCMCENESVRIYCTLCVACASRVFFTLPVARNFVCMRFLMTVVLPDVE